MDAAISTAALTALMPELDDPNVSKIVYSKREFVDSNHETPFGEARPHQANLLKYVGEQSTVDAMAVFWGTGLGKGFTIAQIMRKLHDVIVRDGRNKALLIVKAAIRQQWQTEFAKWPEFTTAKMRADKVVYKIKGREKALSSEIGKTVTIVSLDKFALDLIKMSPERIREKYSCDFCAIDEAHYLRVQEEVSLENLDEVERLDPTTQEAKIAYLMLHKFLMYAKIGLRIVATATPMYDNPLELVSVMSFVLPPEKRLSISDFQIALQGGPDAIREYLEPKLRGRVTFVSDKSGLSPVYDEGKTFFYELEDGSVEESTIKIVECPMLPEQEAVYLKVRSMPENRELLKEQGLLTGNEKKETFYSSSRQALNFVFIDPNNPARNTYNNFEYFFDPDDPKSSKDGFVVMNPPKHLTKAQQQINRDNGKTKRSNLPPTQFSFRYGNDLFAGCPPRNPNLKRFGPGSKLDPQRLEVIRRMSAKFARIIEIVHYDVKYPGEGEMTYYYNPYVKNGGGILLGMCFYAMGYDVLDGTKDDANKYDDRPRFAYMTGEPGSTAARARNVRAIANHPSNAFGDKLAIVIASDSASVGLSFVNARKIILNGGAFTLSRQPEGRVNRTDGHRNFKLQRQKFVRRYYMACTLGDGSQTIDHRLWWNVQQKESKITPTEKVIHEISWDCGMYPGPCRDAYKGTTTDYTTYHLHWAQQEYDQIEQELRKAFQVKNSWTFSELQALMGYDHRPDTLTWALRGMLDRRDVLLDAFGFHKVLREHGGYYFLGNVTETMTSFSPTAHAHITHDVLSQEYTGSFRLAISEDFKTLSTNAVKDGMGDDDESLNADIARWESGDNDAGLMRMVRLEQAILGQIKDKKIRNFILEDLEVAWFSYEDYYFHYLDEMRPKGNGGAYQYNRHRIDGKKTGVSIRVVKKGDSAFRNAVASEVIMFANIINKRWADREQAVKDRNTTKFTVLKNVSSDREIRIRDDTQVKYKKNGEPDGRSAKGLQAKLHEPSVLVEYLYQLGVEYPEEATYTPQKDKMKAEVSKMVGKTASDWSVEKVRFYHSWLSDMKHGAKDRMIAALIKHVTENKLLVMK